MIIADEKHMLRKEIKLLESGLTDKYIKESNHAICDRLKMLSEYKSADTVFCFVSINREPDTYKFINSVLNSGKRLCVPLCRSFGVMESREIKSISELAPGAFGIPEPSQNAPLISADDIDFAVIPCLSCDRYGNRLGKGGGFYDRFLKVYRSHSVMLCFSKLMQEHIPTEEYDCIVKNILTEKGLYSGGNLLIGDK